MTDNKAKRGSKPPRKDAILNRFEVLVEQKEDIISKYVEIRLFKINSINELKLSNNQQMHNRISYSKAKLLELANNINEIEKKGGGILGTGILNPIMVREKNGIFERIHGSNRIDALKLNGKDEVPAINLGEVSDELARFMRTSENLNREDLNAYDETLSIIEHIQLAMNFDSIDSVKKFISKIKNYKAGRSSLSEEEKKQYIEIGKVFEKIGRFNVITFYDRLSVLNINELLKQALVDEIIGYKQAKTINKKLKDDNEAIKKVLSVLKEKNLSIAQIETLIAGMKEELPNEKSKDSTVEITRNKVVLNTNINSLDKKEKESFIKDLNELINKYGIK